MLAVWLGAALILAFTQFAGTGISPLFDDTDDAMRLVVARDFLNGQNWFDFQAHRLNTPFGAEIHWSRFIDLPIAGLLAVSTWLFGEAGALVATGIVWPLLLLAVLIYLSARITKMLVGPSGVLPATLLPVLNPAFVAEFSPGRLDHHNAVLLLTLATVLATLIGQKRATGAWLAGIFAAFALAVALEALPVVAGAVLAFGIAYMFDGSKRVALGRFGLGFALSAVFFLATARPPSRWFEAACDMISPAYVVAAILVGAGYVLIAFIPPPHSARLRLAFLALAGVVTIAAVALLFPQCLRGPYSELHPWLQANWLANISEAKPWHLNVKEMPAYGVVTGASVVLGLVVGCIALSRSSKSDLWRILLIFLVMATLAMLVQVRGARLATMLAIPMGAWLIVKARTYYLRGGKPIAILGLVGAWVVSSGSVLIMLVGIATGTYEGKAAPSAAPETPKNKAECLVPEAFIDLAALPPERIMTPIDLGAHMLLYTNHEVVAAPYHRNQDGVLDAFRFFRRGQDEALDIARKRGLKLLVTCPAMPEMRIQDTAEQVSLLSLIARGELPAWFTEVDGPGPLRVYAINPN